MFAALRDPAEPGNAAAGSSGLRVGVPAEWMRGEIDPEIASIVQAFLRRLVEGGAVAGDVALPPLDVLNACAGTITSFEASALHRATLAERPDWYPAAELDGAFGAADVLLCPVIGGAAPRLDGIGDDDVATAGATTLAFLRFNRPFSLLGLPTLALPAGRDRNGVPVGVQIVGRSGADEVVLALAERFGQPDDAAA